MQSPVEPGDVLDGYRVGERIHAGGTGSIYRVTPPADRDPGFPLLLKLPFLGRGESSIGIISLEMEQIVVARLAGNHVPRFVASGDVRATPYIIMEFVDGESLARIAEQAPLKPEDVARIGAALADAVYSVHRQDVIHFDIKPENFLMRPNGEAVLIDFGFASHARYPDLLAEERQFAAGSAAYVSPEQLQSDRSDARSDLFALGALLYELATGSEPFGDPQTYSGMRDRLWRVPPPPRALNADVPPWLQEIILRCLEPSAKMRYQSAAHVAFDLRHPEQVALTDRAGRMEGLGVFAHFGRWWRARRRDDGGTRRSAATLRRVPVILVAVDTEHPEDERHPAMQTMTRQLLSLHPEVRLMAVSVVAAPVSSGTGEFDTTTSRHLEHKMRLRRWTEPLGFPPERISLHVIEGANASGTLLELAHANHVDLIVIGAPSAAQSGLVWWLSVASTVTANAPCSVYVVRVPERSTDAMPGED